MQRLARTMHERWEGLGPQALESIRDREDIPPEAVSPSVSLDGVMVALRAGEDGRGEACWREVACGTVSFHDGEGERLRTLYLARMPESDKHTLKAQLASEVAHIRRARPDIAVVALPLRRRGGAPDNWTFLESISPEAQAVDFWHSCEHLRTASDHAVDPNWFETCRHTLRHDPHGSARVIRALCYLRDKAGGDRAARTAIERELVFFRKHRKRMRYRHLSDRGIAIGSGVVEAANKTLVTQRMKRSGMRWRIVGGQIVLTVRALIKIRPFRPRLGNPHGRCRYPRQRKELPRQARNMKRIRRSSPTALCHTHASGKMNSSSFTPESYRITLQSSPLSSVIFTPPTSSWPGHVMFMAVMFNSWR